MTQSGLFWQRPTNHIEAAREVACDLARRVISVSESVTFAGIWESEGARAVAELHRCLREDGPLIRAVGEYLRGHYPTPPSSIGTVHEMSYHELAYGLAFRVFSDIASVSGARIMPSRRKGGWGNEENFDFEKVAQRHEEIGAALNWLPDFAPGGIDCGWLDKYIRDEAERAVKAYPDIASLPYPPNDPKNPESGGKKPNRQTGKHWSFEPGRAIFDGKVYEITPKPLKVLELFVGSRLTVLGYQDLREILGDGYDLADDTIRSHLAALRSTLRNVAKDAGYANDIRKNPLPNKNGGWELKLPRP